MRNLIAPTPPKDKSFDFLVKTLKDHFEPAPLPVTERFHFHRRVQTPNKTVTEYVAQLWRLSTHCQYGGFLEESIRDQFLWGLCSKAIQKRLLTEKDLTLANNCKFKDAECHNCHKKGLSLQVKALGRNHLERILESSKVIHVPDNKVDQCQRRQFNAR